MRLTDDDVAFSREVNKARPSGNLDAPEGGFDALMQAIVCKEEIGWRRQARHLIVFSTDESFHVAGDGKLAGVVEPNDGKCHMKDDLYTHSLILDYPSVSHINYVAKENNINIIFAVVQQGYAIYKDLERSIENSLAGVLESNSENVVNLIQENYNVSCNVTHLVFAAYVLQGTLQTAGTFYVVNKQVGIITTQFIQTPLVY